MNARPLFSTDLDVDRAVERVAAALAAVEPEKVDAVARAVRVEREAGRRTLTR
jgi:hypothetical protein